MSNPHKFFDIMIEENRQPFMIAALIIVGLILAGAMFAFVIANALGQASPPPPPDCSKTVTGCNPPSGPSGPSSPHIENPVVVPIITVPADSGVVLPVITVPADSGGDRGREIIDKPPKEEPVKTKGDCAPNCGK